jgi:fructan beta-fructosidase
MTFFSALSLPVSAAPTTTAYKEQYRPAYHFSPQKAWMNDPNGLIYYKGVYHLFYQYYPDGNTWGPMHWGHAVSRDMVHWVDKPIALSPDEHGMIFSGSAVVDWNNTSGLGARKTPPLVAIFTANNDNYEQDGLQEHQNEALAYSTDGGETWTKYKGNPVLRAPAGKPDFRDPKVRWNEATKSWVMTLAVGDHTEFYGSPDLKTWTYLSQFGAGLGAHGGVWECPDLFPIKVAETGKTKWVLLQSLNPGGPNGGSGTQYFVGDFNGKTFKLDSKFAAQLKAQGARWIDWGSDNYAGVTWSDIPKRDGRVLSIAWMSNWDYAEAVPTTVWRSAMTLPRELTLHVDAAGYSLRSQPVAELKTLWGPRHVTPPQIVSDRLQATVPAGAVTQSETTVEFPLPPQGTKAYLEFSNAEGDIYRIGYDGDHGYFSDRRKSGVTEFSDKFANAIHTAPRISQADNVKMRVFMDRDSVEMFADDGASVMTESLFPREPYTKVTFVVNGVPVSLSELAVREIKSIH